MPYSDNDPQAYFHLPVLCREAMEGLKLKQDGIYVDCTVGGGGHSEEILNLTSPGGVLIGLDRDRDALSAAKERLSRFGQRVILVHSNFARLPEVLKGLGVELADGVLYDLGVSSYQLDNPERGFSYQKDAPLDMRMDRDSGPTAGDLVNSLPEEGLTGIIRSYGEEKFAARIASFIARSREKGKIETTGQLVEIIKAAIPARFRRQGPHPAKRTFQALRIAVNRELEVLHGSLTGMVGCLKPGGRACVVTFHSLEDRIVKETFRDMARPCKCPADFPVCVCGLMPSVRLITPGGIKPAGEEMEANPRSRSARLRIVEKV